MIRRLWRSRAQDSPCADLDNGGVVPQDRTVIASIHLATISADLTSLAVSLVFGAGQCAVGAGFVAHELRGARWRRGLGYAAIIFGVWLACSGAAELVVSSSRLAAAWWSVPSPAALARVREVADATLLAVSIVLLVTLPLSLLWLRWLPARPRPDRP